MSSFGNAPSRQKSIDVEFNLLRTWSAARRDLHRRLAQHAAMGLGVLLIGAVVLPLLYGARGAAAAQAAKAKNEAREMAAAVKANEERALLVLPVVERDAEILSSAKRVNSLLSGIATVLNASPETLVVRNLQFEVTGGILTVRLRAEAPDAATARTFARRVGATPGIAGAKASSIINEGSGVAFDFTCTGGLQ